MDENDEDERGLEETLEKLGFGAYHWRLLALCGFGWMSDNSALQCIGAYIRQATNIAETSSCNSTPCTGSF